jgi:hypothetical protein
LLAAFGGEQCMVAVKLARRGDVNCVDGAAIRMAGDNFV